jgi:hypothetical protein
MEGSEGFRPERGDGDRGGGGGGADEQALGDIYHGGADGVADGAAVDGVKMQVAGKCDPRGCRVEP